MKRKVIKQGPSSVMISLPIKWVKRFDISKGDEINIEEKANNLLVSADKREKIAKADINLESSDSLYIWRLLQSAYVNGHDEIRFLNTNQKSLEAIQSHVANYLIGFEIVKQEKNYCIIKAISSETVEDFDLILKRVFQGVLQMSEVFRENFVKKRKPLMIKNLEKMNNRHTMYLKRVLVKNKTETPYLYMVVTILEKIANEYKYLLKDFDFRKGFSKSALDFYTKLHDQLERIYDIFFKYDSKKVKKVITEDIRVEKFKILFKNTPDLAYSFMRITDFLRTILFETNNIHYSKEN